MMRSTGMFELIMMLALPMGGGNDLLDFVPTDQFWGSQGGVDVSGRSMISELRVTAAKDISALIQQLSDVEFRTREQACREIMQYGPGVIPQLEAAAKSTGGETAMRAGSLARLLGGNVSNCWHFDKSPCFGCVINFHVSSKNRAIS